MSFLKSFAIGWHKSQLKGCFMVGKYTKFSPPFEGGVAGPLYNYGSNADTGRGG